jgi:hypothetical protein
MLVKAFSCMFEAPHAKTINPAGIAGPTERAPGRGWPMRAGGRRGGNTQTLDRRPQRPRDAIRPRDVRGRLADAPAAAPSGHSYTPHLHLIYTSFTPHLHLIRIEISGGAFGGRPAQSRRAAGSRRDPAGLRIPDRFVPRARDRLTAAHEPAPSRGGAGAGPAGPPGVRRPPPPLRTSDGPGQPVPRGRGHAAGPSTARPRRQVCLPQVSLNEVSQIAFVFVIGTTPL